MGRVRVLLWLMAGLAALGFGWLTLRQPIPSPSPPPATSPTLGGAFTLVDADGRAFSSSKLQGKPFAIYFGFTHCPDVCPTTLARLVRLRAELKQGSQPFNIVFVTVDPERDGPKELASFLSAFGGPVTGLTGSRAQIEQVKRQFGIYSKKMPGTAGGYMVDHTTAVILFDRNGKFAATLAPGTSDGAALDQLGRIVA